MISVSETALRTMGNRPFEVNRVRADFPALHRTMHGRRLVYLGNAATIQKPRSLIEALAHTCRHDDEIDILIAAIGKLREVLG